MTVVRGCAAALAAALGWMALAPGFLPVLAILLTGWLLVRSWRRSAHPVLESGWEKVRPRSASSRTVRSRGDRNRDQDGLASPAEIRREGSARAVRAKTPVVRPSLACLSRTERWRHVRTRDVGVLLCRVGRQNVWASVEDVILAFAGPRQGKSGWMGARIIDFPGPIVVTSVRPDLLDNTRRHRARRGPVWVFNAAGITNLDGEITFDPLTDCAAPEAARERAADMIPEEAGETEKWASLARSALASLLHAAALGGYTMHDVQAWAAAPRKDAHQVAIEKALRGSSMLQEARQFLENNDKTQTSITTSIMPALQWLSSSTARAAAGLEGQAAPFRVESLLAGTATLYVVGRLDVHTEPLLSALTGYIARAARRYAVTAPSGRLDPPLGLMLDEAARLAPPLPDWTSDMGGSGITIVAAFQSRAQMIETWGRQGAGIVLSNAGGILLGGGTKDPDDLQAWADILGTRDETTTTTDHRGVVTGTTERAVPILSSSQLANLPRQQVVVWRSGMPPAIGRTRMVWERWDLHPPALLRWAISRRETSRHLSRMGERPSQQPLPLPPPPPTREAVVDRVSLSG